MLTASFPSRARPLAARNPHGPGERDEGAMVQTRTGQAQGLDHHFSVWRTVNLAYRRHESYQPEVSNGLNEGALSA